MRASADMLSRLYFEAKPVDSVLSLLDMFVQDKKVLDIGCANYAGEYAFGLNHGQIVERCTECVGIDISPALLKLPKRNNVRYFVANAEEFRISETFDTIFAGDVIEHLSNIGQFLEGARTMMHRDTDLIIVTPNPYGLRSIISLFRGFEPPIHPEHTVLVPISGIVELCTRHGLAVNQIFLVKGQKLLGTDRWLRSAYKRIYRMVIAIPGMAKFVDTLAFQIRKV